MIVTAIPVEGALLPAVNASHYSELFLGWRAQIRIHFAREFPACATGGLRSAGCQKELLWGLPRMSHLESRPMTRVEYLAFFADAPADAVCVAEASPMYLYSSEAPQQIAALNADARIVIVLRDPVQLVRSMHMQNVESRIEPFFDLESALAAESLRSAGVPVPRRQQHTTHAYLRYTAIGTYAPQLQRYFAVFPRRQIHVMIFERLLSAQQEELSRLLEFLRPLPVDGGELRYHSKIQP